MVRFYLVAFLSYAILLGGGYKLESIRYEYHHFIYDKTIKIKDIHYFKMDNSYYATITTPEGLDYTYTYFDINKNTPVEVYIGKEVHRAYLNGLFYIEKLYNACTDDKTVTEQSKSFYDKVAEQVWPDDIE